MSRLTIRVVRLASHCVRGLFLAGLVGGGIAAAEDGEPYWPQFHGPNRDNVSPDTGLMQTWPEGGPDLAWKAAGIGFGYSAVSLANGAIYTAGNIGEQTVVTALDLDGAIQWQAKNGKAWAKKPNYPGTRGTPAIDGDRVYHESPHGDVICLDAKTGAEIWKVNILEKYQGKNIYWALSESLSVDGDKVICSPGGPEASIVALDKKTGSVVWEAPSLDELAGYASPVVFEYGGLRVITTLTAKSCIGVNADTGGLLWRIDHESYTNQNTMTPLFHDGHLFISTIRADAIKWKVLVDGDTVSLEEVWRTDQFDNQHGGVILAEGNIYGTSRSRNRNQLVCLDWETGEIENGLPGVAKAALTYADGLIYMLEEDRRMSLVRPTATGSARVSSFTIPEGGEGNSWAHPVVVGGRLYVRHGDFLYAYDVRESR